jgi:hypothetical protein
MSKIARAPAAITLLLWITTALSTLIYFALTLPIQTDEIAWAFVNHRAVIDDYQVMSLYPQCGRSVFPASLPTLAYPAAWINHMIYSLATSPFYFRLIGLGRLLVSLLFLALITRKIIGEKYLPVFAVALSFLFLDSTTVLLVMARPEQALVLGVLTVLLITLHARTLSERPVAIKVLFAAVFMLVVLQTTYAHAKAIALLPFFIAAAILFSQGMFLSKTLRILFPLAIGSIGIAIYRFWSVRLHCPDSMEVQRMLYNYNLSIGQGLVDPREFFREALTNFSLALMQDLWIYPEELQGGWLRSEASGYLLKSAMVPAALAFVLRLSVLGASLQRCVMRALGRAPVTNGEAQTAHILLAVTMLFAFVPLFFFLGPTRPTYLSALEIPLLLLVALLLFGRDVSSSRGFRISAFTLMIVSSINLLLHLTIYPYSSPLEAVETERLISFSPGTGDTDTLRELARECLIDPLHANHLVLDDRTYLAFKESTLPFHIHYVTDRYYSFTGYYTDIDVKRFLRTLALYASDGLVVDCRNLPRQFLAVAASKEGYCCVPASKLLEDAGQPLLSDPLLGGF